MSAYNLSSNGLVEASVEDVKLTVPDILGQVSLGFGLRPGVSKKLLVSRKGFVVSTLQRFSCLGSCYPVDLDQDKADSWMDQTMPGRQC